MRHEDFVFFLFAVAKNRQSGLGLRIFSPSWTLEWCQTFVFLVSQSTLETKMDGRVRKSRRELDPFTSLSYVKIARRGLED